MTKLQENKLRKLVRKVLSENRNRNSNQTTGNRRNRVRKSLKEGTQYGADYFIELVGAEETLQEVERYMSTRDWNEMAEHFVSQWDLDM